MERVDLLKEVFDTKMAAILNLFLENPARSFSLTEISEACGTSIATTHRKMNDLLRKEIVHAHKKENAKKVQSYRLAHGEKTVALSRVFAQKPSGRFSQIFGRMN